MHVNAHWCHEDAQARGGSCAREKRARKIEASRREGQTLAGEQTRTTPTTMEDVDNNSVGSHSKNDARDATGNKNPPALLIESQSASSFTASPTQDHMTITDADLPAFMVRKSEAYSDEPLPPLHM